MLANISDDIIATLNEVTYDFDDAVAVRSFDAANKSFPRIVVHQYQNMMLSRATTLTDSTHPIGLKEVTSLIAIQIEIYARDAMNTAGVVKTRHEVSDSIAAAVDAAIFNTYGFNRDMVSDRYAFDTTTAVQYLRYSGVLDESGYIHRTSSDMQQNYSS